VLIALDRQERGQGTLSAAQEVQAEFGIPVIAVARLTNCWFSSTRWPNCRLIAPHCRPIAFATESPRERPPPATIAAVAYTGQRIRRGKGMRSITANMAALLLTMATGSACFAAAASHHKQYRWSDASGNLHYSDTLTTDAIQSGYDVINDKGIVVKHIDRAQDRSGAHAAEAAAGGETAANSRPTGRPRRSPTAGGLPDGEDLVGRVRCQSTASSKASSPRPTA
jgi:hypothetical protein